MKLKGLGHHCHRMDGAFFIDDRIQGLGRKAPIVAWLNCNRGRFSLNIVRHEFKSTAQIPRQITNLGDAIEFVYQNSKWL